MWCRLLTSSQFTDYCLYRSANFSILFCVLLSMFSLVSLPSLSATSQVVSLVTEHYPPYQIVSESGEITGIHAKIIQRIKQKTNLSFDEQVMPWARAYHTALNRSNTCIYSMIRLPEREDNFTWIGELGPSVEKIFATKKTAKDLTITSVADVKKYIVAAQRGDLIIELLTKRGFDVKTNLMEVSNWTQTIKLVLYGRAQLIVSNQEIIDYYFNVLHLPPDTLVPVYTLPELSEAKHYLACHPDTDQDILTQLTLAIAEVNQELQRQSR